MTGQGHVNEPATYELRVHGELGPVLLSALPHEAFVRVPEHTVLVTAGSDDRDLVELLKLIVALGLEVDSVRRATNGDSR
jgi:hypothetical protein